MSVGTASTASTPSKAQSIATFPKIKHDEELLPYFEKKANENECYKKLIPSLYVYSSLHGCIDQLVPTNYKLLESSIGLSPKSLGMLTFAQKFTQGLFTLISGLACDRQMDMASKSYEPEEESLIYLCEQELGNQGNRQHLGSSNFEYLKAWPAYFMMVTSIGWGMVMLSMIFASSFFQMLTLLCLLGAFLSVMGPLTQSIIGTFSSVGRSEHFGNLFLSQNIGRLFCLSATANIMGQYFDFTWVLLLFSLLSLLFSVYIYRSCIEHAFNLNGAKLKSKKGVIYMGENGLFSYLKDGFSGISFLGSQKGIFDFLDEYLYVISNKSAWLMLTMGIVNGIPRHSLNFTMMWLQYCGLSPLLATVVYSSSWISAILISPFVGKASDYIESIYPWIGRQVLAQSAILLRIVFMFILLRCIPWGSANFVYYLLVSILIGFMAGWPGVGASRPILCQIVRPHHRATLFAFFSLFETLGSAIFGAPIVGMLAQHYFGYDSSLKKDIREIISNNDVSGIRTLRQNANALASSMMCMTIIPWMLTIIIFGLLRLTYKHDRASEEQRPNESPQIKH
ncbi:transporter, major facilitator family protein [Cryptosporidium felis]|nr:transporter, major facilitator family protein [Cryptosporidium felis]